MSETTIQPTQDERVAAALAHGSILLSLFTNGLGGFIGAALVWLTQKDKSRYVAFQALQALVYQAVLLVLSVVGWGCFMCVVFGGTMIPALLDPQAYQHAAPPGVWGMLCLLPFGFLISALFVLYGLYAAWRTLGGADFRYVVIGRMIEQRLGRGTE